MGNELRCLFVLIIFISDSHFGVSYSYLHKIWKEHMLCYVAGVVFIFSRQMYLHSCLGQILWNFYIVSARYVLKPGQKSQSVKLYLFAGVFVYLTLSVAAHIFVKPNSDFCISVI